MAVEVAMAVALDMAAVVVRGRALRAARVRAADRRVAKSSRKRRCCECGNSHSTRVCVRVPVLAICHALFRDKVSAANMSF